MRTAAVNPLFHWLLITYEQLALEIVLLVEDELVAERLDELEELRDELIELLEKLE